MDKNLFRKKYTKKDTLGQVLFCICCIHNFATIKQDGRDFSILRSAMKEEQVPPITLPKNGKTSADKKYLTIPNKSAKSSPD